MDHPKLRPLEAIVAEKNSIYLRDPEGISDAVLLLKPAAVFICSLFDGAHSVMDIQNEFMRQFGEVLFTDDVKAIEAKLDSCLFLDNERFSNHKEKIVSDFFASPVRPAAHAGKSYEDDPESLGSFLKMLIGRAGEPGDEEPVKGGSLRAIITPHIDLGRGGDCYGAAYGALASANRAKTIVVLGISHMPSVMPYILTKKNFATPFGTLDTDNDFIDRLACMCDTDFFKDEFIHRNEHSVEFQALFLKYLFREYSDIRIVPVLCSSVPRIVLSDKSPYEDTEVRSFIDALADSIRGNRGDTCLIAGVDLSHVGKRFGQDVHITPDYLSDLEAYDRSLMRYVTECDAEGFMRSVKRDKDSRNICGVPAIYTMLKVLELSNPNGTTNGRICKYNQSVEESHSVVTFASAAFYDQK
jgi:AmmeMemoRadiSam system protein B